MKRFFQFSQPLITGVLMSLVSKCRLYGGIALLISFLLVDTAVAGDIIGIKIASTMATRSTVTATGGALFINLPAGVTHASPSCGVPNNYRYAIKGTDKQMIAQAMMAYAAGKTVDIYGTGDCEAWGDTESVLYVTIR